MNPNIRRMTLEDIPAVMLLDQLTSTLPWPERSFRYEVTSNPASRSWVAELDGLIVGTLVAWLLVDEAHIAIIATHPDYRRRGIARKLLTHGLAYMSEEGAISSFLEVRESNLIAQELYRKFGYEASGRRKRYYKDNGEDAILMMLDPLKVENFVSDV